MSDEATVMLRRLCEGDRAAAAELYLLVYDRLHDIAEHMLRNEPPTASFQATSIANDVYLQLIDQRQAEWRSRSHFLAVAAQATRRFLVDHARARLRLKRGGGWRRISLSSVAAREAGRSDVDVLELEDALNRLAELDARQARVVELRFFSALTEEQIAEALGVSRRTVQGDWAHARAWLKRAFGKGMDR